MVTKELVRLKNGKYIAGTKKGSKTIFIEMISDHCAGL